MRGGRTGCVQGGGIWLPREGGGSYEICKSRCVDGKGKGEGGKLLYDAAAGFESDAQGRDLAWRWLFLGLVAARDHVSGAGFLFFLSSGCYGQGRTGAVGPEPLAGFCISTELWFTFLRLWAVIVGVVHEPRSVSFP